MKTILTVLSLVIFSSITFAGPGSGHSHGLAKVISKDEAIQLAQSYVSQLSDAKKLDASWETNLKADRIEEFTLKGTKVWRVTLNNPIVKNSSQSQVYTFISKLGEVIGASFEADPNKKIHSHGGGKPHSH